MLLQRVYSSTHCRRVELLRESSFRRRQGHIIPARRVRLFQGLQQLSPNLESPLSIEQARLPTGTPPTETIDAYPQSFRDTHAAGTVAVHASRQTGLTNTDYADESSPYGVELPRDPIALPGTQPEFP